MNHGGLRPALRPAALRELVEAAILQLHIPPAPRGVPGQHGILILGMGTGVPVNGIFKTFPPGSALEVNATTVFEDEVDVGVGVVVADQKDIVIVIRADAESPRHAILGPIDAPDGDGRRAVERDVGARVEIEAGEKIYGIAGGDPRLCADEWRGDQESECRENRPLHGTDHYEGPGAPAQD